MNISYMNKVDSAIHISYSLLIFLSSYINYWEDMLESPTIDCAIVYFPFNSSFALCNLKLYY